MSSTGQPSRTTRRVRGLTHRLAEARDIHALSADPLLAAVTAERFRVSITRGMWLFLALGLGYTTTGVHAFLAGHLTMADPLWWGAWLVEPAFAGILITLLRWEAAMLTHSQLVDHPSVTRLKRLLLAATLITNVWSSLAPATGPVSAGTVFLHIVIPLVVFLIAEVMPVITTHCVAVRDHALALVDQHPQPSTFTEPTPADVPAEAALTTSAVESPADQPPNVVVSTPAPVPPVVDPPRPAPSTTSVVLPPALRDRIETRRADLGRALTAPEISELLKVGPGYAQQLAAQLT